METLALILAGGRGSRLDILSEKRSKPAVPLPENSESSTLHCPTVVIQAFSRSVF